MKRFQLKMKGFRPRPDPPGRAWGFAMALSPHPMVMVPYHWGWGDGPRTPNPGSYMQGKSSVQQQALELVNTIASLPVNYFMIVGMYNTLDDKYDLTLVDPVLDYRSSEFLKTLMMFSETLTRPCGSRCTRQPIVSPLDWFERLGTTPPNNECIIIW